MHCVFYHLCIWGSTQNLGGGGGGESNARFGGGGGGRELMSIFQGFMNFVVTDEPEIYYTHSKKNHFLDMC